MVRKLMGIKEKQMIGYHRYPMNLFRKLPGFIIIGSQKAATSTLHYYLSKNSNIQRPPIKEAQFFNMNYDRGIPYYKSIFPIHKVGKVTFETTPDYLSHPLAPRLCHQLLPDIKLVVTLRNPVERAFSHFNFVKNYGGEAVDVSFEQGLELEQQRIDDALDLMAKDRYNSARLLSRYGYRRNGEYASHLKTWLHYYPIDQFYFIDFEDIKNDVNTVMRNLCDFLELPFEPIKSKTIKNKSVYKEVMNDKLLVALKNHYASHNENLYKLIGKKYQW